MAYLKISIEESFRNDFIFPKASLLNVLYCGKLDDILIKWDKNYSTNDKVIDNFNNLHPDLKFLVCPHNPLFVLNTHSTEFV
jgi:hypothetical protein